MCPRRELNPYSPYGPQDFKSCVSTSSTTGAMGISNKEQGMMNIEVASLTSAFDIPCSLFDILILVRYSNRKEKKSRRGGKC